MNATIAPAARIRVTRLNSLGRTHFVKVGRVLEVAGDLFKFEDETGRRVWLTVDPTEIEGVMKGWTQSYEVL
ncbi:hypothetical protein AB0N28_03480 [Streptomyces sp. NPDC051130]|uniref:hypothetical protein n=1 Tax=Streptomyces sp. NPDC051130 TaxID=3157223 RepID=UPI0034341AE2